MKIMVVGGGGREHAIIKKIKENKNVTEIFALPGNGGMKDDATLVNIGAKDIENIVKLSLHNHKAIVNPTYEDYVQVDKQTRLNCLNMFKEEK